MQVISFLALFKLALHNKHQPCKWKDYDSKGENKQTLNQKSRYQPEFWKIRVSFANAKEEGATQTLAANSFSSPLFFFQMNLSFLISLPPFHSILQVQWFPSCLSDPVYQNFHHSHNNSACVSFCLCVCVCVSKFPLGQQRERSSFQSTSSFPSRFLLHSTLLSPANCPLFPPPGVFLLSLFYSISSIRTHTTPMSLLTFNLFLPILTDIRLHAELPTVTLPVGCCTWGIRRLVIVGEQEIKSPCRMPECRLSSAAGCYYRSQHVSEKACL